MCGMIRLSIHSVPTTCLTRACFALRCSFRLCYSETNFNFCLSRPPNFILTSLHRTTTQKPCIASIEITKVNMQSLSATLSWATPVKVEVSKDLPVQS